MASKVFPKVLQGALGAKTRGAVANAIRGNLGQSGSGANLFEKGQTAVMSRAFSMDDVQAFCRVTGDLNTVHLEQGIVPGLLCASMIPSVFASRCPGAIYVSQNLSFVSPVLVGQTATCTLQVASVKNLKGKLVVECLTNIHDSTDQVIIKGSARVLLTN